MHRIWARRPRHQEPIGPQDFHYKGDDGSSRNPTIGGSNQWRCAFFSSAAILSKSGSVGSRCRTMPLALGIGYSSGGATSSSVRTRASSEWYMLLKRSLGFGGTHTQYCANPTT